MKVFLLAFLNKANIVNNDCIGDDYPGVWEGELPGEAAAGAVAQGGGVVVQQQLRAAGRHRGQREVLGE